MWKGVFLPWRGGSWSAGRGPPEQRRGDRLHIASSLLHQPSFFVWRPRQGRAFCQGETSMRLRDLLAGLVAAVLLTASMGCCCKSWCGRTCNPPPPPCCPGASVAPPPAPGAVIPPPPPGAVTP